MAIDNTNKRASAGVQGLDFLTILPAPDGEIDGTDRSHLAGLYADNTNAPAVAEFVGATWTNYEEVRGSYYQPGKPKNRKNKSIVSDGPPA